MGERDFKYSDLISGATEWKALMKNIVEIKSACLKESADAFAANLLRGASFAAMPSQIAFMVRRDQIFYDNAIFKANGGKKEIQLSDFNEAMPPEVGAHTTEQMKRYMDTSVEEVQKLTWKLGVGYVQTLTQLHPAMQKSVEALFVSLLLDAWTAFECLASDLWATGVDKGPSDIVARLHVSSSKFQKGDENLTPENVHSLDSDAKTQHGSFLRETGRVSFQKLENIKLYYSIAFGNNAKKLFDETAGGYIHALSSVRNILIHKSGIADKKFVEQAQRFPELKNIKAGQQVLLDGALVLKLRMAAGDMGNALIHLVDDILTPATT
jgi:hypothetical protein